MSIELDYDLLKPGTVIGVTSTGGILSWLIKATTRGLKYANCKDTASHIVVVAEHQGLYYGIEMTWPKIRRVDLNSIGDIVFVRKHVRLDNSEMQDRANWWLWESHSKGIRYDLKGLLEFWKIGKDDKGKMYCSELYYYMLKYLKIEYPKKWDKKVSPYDVQTATMHINLQ
jgi:hypothetical protein